MFGVGVLLLFILGGAAFHTFLLLLLRGAAFLPPPLGGVAFFLAFVGVACHLRDGTEIDTS